MKTSAFSPALLPPTTSAFVAPSGGPVVYKDVTPLSTYHANATFAVGHTADYRRLSTGASGAVNAAAGTALLGLAAGFGATISTGGVAALVGAGGFLVWLGMRGLVGMMEPPGVHSAPRLQT